MEKEFIKKIKIGNVELDNNVFLAPMAGITDRPFRIICKKFGPGLVFTEMVSSKGLFYKDSKTDLLLNMKDEKRPVAVQIFGNDVEAMKYAAEYVSKFADIVDINMGCPAPKVVKNGDGSKLLLNLDLAEEIVKAVVEAVKKPVTVKIRKGWNNSNIVAVEAAKRFERAGVKAITIHGRTREDYYSGTCDLEIIKQVKEAVSIPVIRNGDIRNVQSAQKMFEYTGVDAIMIGRASLGNPWVFKSIIEGTEYIPINREKLDIILEHLELMIKEKGEYVAIREMRKHISGYTKNLPNSSKFREEMNKIENKDELVKYITEYLSC